LLPLNIKGIQQLLRSTSFPPYKKMHAEVEDYPIHK
jgi:hypothetical protein